MALDGWRVRNARQYATIRALSSSAELRWIVWKDNRYQEATMRSANRRMDNLRMRPYRPGQPRSGDEMEPL